MRMKHKARDKLFIDCTFERGLDRNQVERLSATEFVRDHKDPSLPSLPEQDKSYLAAALGYKACPGRL